MKNKKTLWIIVILLIVIGSMLMAMGLCYSNKKGIYFSNTGLHIVGNEKKEQKQLNLETITGIEIDVDNFNVIIEQGDTYGIEISSYDNEIEWQIKDGVLKATEKKQDEFRFFSLDFRFLYGNAYSYLKIYLPSDALLDNINMAIKDANAKVSNVNAKTLTLENKYGRVELEKLKIDTIQMEMKDGSFSGKNIIAQQISLNNEYGKANFDNIESQALTAKLKDGNLELNTIQTEEMNLNSKYGKITGKELQVKNSKTEAKDGKIDLEGDLTGNTEILSTYGEVRVNLKEEKEYYNLDLTTKDGKIVLDEERLKDSKNYTTNRENGKMLKITARDGSIYVHFNQ